MKPKGVKIITEEAEKDITFLCDVDPFFVSLVKHGANQQPFRVIKEDTEKEITTPTDTNLYLDPDLAININDIAGMEDVLKELKEGI